MKLKEALHKACVTFVDKKQYTIDTTISSNQKALESETKSSAGDKHETGRAMLQLEMEKASQQLVVVQQMRETLNKINLESKASLVCLGSVVETNIGIYFLAISAGNIVLESTNYFAISIASPIGKLLLGKKLGDEVVFNGKKIVINKLL